MTRRVPVILAVTGAMALSACATDPYGQPTNMSRTQQGVLAGAATGAILGAVRDDDSNNRGRDIARGAIVGGAAGGPAEPAGEGAVFAVLGHLPSLSPRPVSDRGVRGHSPARDPVA